MPASEYPGKGRLRLIDTDLADPRYTVILDECILLARSQDQVPDTLHLYRRSRPAISLGHFQEAEECVHLDRVIEHGVELVRRISGGSAIYTDPGQLVYSLVLPERSLPERPIDSYPLVCAGIVQALEILGIRAVWKPLNDVEVEGRKISGSAQTRKKGAVLQQGTVIIDSDLELMTSLFRPVPGKQVRERAGMTSVRQELGRPVAVEQVKQSLIEGFSQVLGLEPYYGALTDGEKGGLASLSRERYCQSHGLH